MASPVILSGAPLVAPAIGVWERCRQKGKGAVARVRYSLCWRRFANATMFLTAKVVHTSVVHERHLSSDPVRRLIAGPRPAPRTLRLRLV